MGAQMAGGILAGAGQVLGAEMEADANEYNAAMAKYEADYAREKAGVEERAYRKILGRTMGTAQMVVGGTGFGNEGTNTDLLDQIRREGEIDAAMIRHGGDVEYWRLRSEGDFLSSQTKGIRASGHLSAAATMLGASGAGTQTSRYRASALSGGSGGSTSPLLQKSDVSWMDKYRWSPRQ